LRTTGVNSRENTNAAIPTAIKEYIEFAFRYPDNRVSEFHQIDRHRTGDLNGDLEWFGEGTDRKHVSPWCTAPDTQNTALSAWAIRMQHVNQAIAAIARNLIEDN
jgi:hypothetical protein